MEYPFWRDLKEADPCRFFSPDPLHQNTIFLQAHLLLQWIPTWVRDYDSRLAVLQPLIGEKHFPKGFTRFKQHTGKESKSLTRTILPLLAGCPSVNVDCQRAVRGLIHYSYLLRYPSHTTKTLRYLQDAIRDFHRYKHHIAATGVRDGIRQNNEFNIPKIELMHHTARLIKLHGSAEQNSTEQPETQHIYDLKRQFPRTNKKDFAPQICNLLTRRDSFRFYTPWIEWRSIVEDANAQGPVELQAAEEKATQHMIGRIGPKPVRDIFKTTESTLCTETTAIQLGQKPSMKELGKRAAELLYELPNFFDDLRRYFLSDSRTSDSRLPFDTINTWFKIRIQLRDPQDADYVLDPVTVQAKPPKTQGDITIPGRYNFVMLHRDAAAGETSRQGEFGIQGIVLVIRRSFGFPFFFFFT